MFEQILKFSSENKNIHLFVENGTAFDICEKFALDFLQHIGMMKSQQAAMLAAQKVAEEANKTEDPLKEA